MARTAAGPAPEDLTARAKIRDVALLQFAEHGMRGATFRGIAEAAGVSVGLVQHHFGSKEELREACDAYALDTVRDLSSTSAAGRWATPVSWPRPSRPTFPCGATWHARSSTARRRRPACSTTWSR
ncbi:TetR/AcrR family transcriptional regulator [Actinomadura luteofluorescens]|uniref:TetR/AcrR family transcriptional regulator n=1 Tax=Actinomadura luteofluorescens TaxID=46163 RepID=UPI0036452074